ncbi:MAG: universal stress protein [Pseudomonadota bacterium]
MPLSKLHTIMLPVRGDGKGDNVLAHAAVLAHRFGARVRVVHCRPKSSDLMSYGVVIPKVVREQIEEAMSSASNVTEGQLIAEFRELAEKFGLAEQEHTAGVATARFIEFSGKQVEAVRAHGRLADLICVPQPDPTLNLGINTLKSALFSSGRPVMMCPEQQSVSKNFADHVAIGWNGSLEATRAVAMSMPLIASAKSVTILSGGRSQAAAGPDELMRYLELKEVSSKMRKFDTKSKNVGEMLLEETKAAGAGMLIMGAYHESYERESLFGGNSHAVVHTADIPVVLVH